MKILGKEIAPLGMGCWPIGGAFYAGDIPLGYSNVDNATSTKTVHAALDAGIRLFDAAAVYGAGEAERVLGAALKGQNDVIIMSKFGLPFDEKSKQMLAADCNPENIEAAIDASLKRLQREQIEVMQLHLNDLAIELATPIFEELERLRIKGKIGAYGWSTDFPDRAASMSNMKGFIGIQHAMNVFADVPSIQTCVEENKLIAFIRSPLAMGVLSGKFDANSLVPCGDVRSVNSNVKDYFHNRKVAPHCLKNLNAIGETLQTGGRTLPQGALGWLLAKSDRNIPLPGARTPEQIRDNAGAIQKGPLPAHVMDEIEILISREAETEIRAR